MQHKRTCCVVAPFPAKWLGKAMNTTAKAKSTQYRHIEVETHESASVVRILCEKLVSQYEIDCLWRELDDLSEQSAKPNLLLDFSVVKLASSPMLGKLIRFKEQITGNDGKLVLCNLQPMVHRVFKLTRLNTTFDIQADKSEGLAALSSS